MPPMMHRVLPPTCRRLRASRRPLPRRNVATPLFRTVWPLQALTESHRALWQLPYRELPPLHEMLAVFDIQYSMPKERTISNTGESAATEHGPRDRQNVSYERSSRPPHLGGLAAHESPAWDFLDLS